MTRALYPGTFDPITKGHLDIIERASKLFDELIVSIASGVHKDAYFPLTTRKKLLEASVKRMPGVRVSTFKGLLADQCSHLSVDVVIRGLRAVSDFEYELMLALMNRKLNPGFETVFLMPSEQYIYLRSSLVKEIFFLGGDISSLVPPAVVEAFKRRSKSKRAR
jgi:pantetheine-phosphate adenylyltransferase